MARTNAAPHNAAVKLAAADRRLRALDLRKAGATLHQIAAQTGVSHEQARKDLQRAMADLLAEQNASAEELRALELERLERLHLALWPQATQGHQGAVDRLLRIAERRAKLLGLDVPVRSIMELDWRKELEAAGVKASDLFEQMVAQIAEQLADE